MNETKRTSISLPSELVEKLKKYSEEIDQSLEFIILVSLKKFLKRFLDRAELNNRITIEYNTIETCDAKIYLYLDASTQKLLRYIRLSQSISASFIIYLALIKFLDIIYTGINPGRKKDRLRRMDIYNKYFIEIQKFFFEEGITQNLEIQFSGFFNFKFKKRILMNQTIIT